MKSLSDTKWSSNFAKLMKRERVEDREKKERARVGERERV